MQQLIHTLITILLTLALSACGGSDNRGSNSSSGKSSQSSNESSTSSASSDSSTSSTNSSSSDESDSFSNPYDNQAQKGPFRAGATVTVTRLGDDSAETDDQAQTQVEENGGFTFPEVSWEGPTLVSIEGTFFNEVTANFSSESRQLTAIVDLPGEEDANVNLFTHMVAEGVRHYMAEGHDFYDDDLRRILRDALEQLVGITSSPLELDLLDATQNPDESDGANLLLFSAALLKAELDASDLANIFDDFQHNGKIDSDGKDAWQRIQLASENNPDLLSQAVTTLQNQYGSTPPDRINSGAISWQLSPCAAAQLSEPRAVCVDDSFKGEHAQDNKERVVFVPPVTGRYTVWLDGDPDASDDNANTCRWEMGTKALGDSDHTDGFCGVEDYTGVLQAGERYVINPTVGKYEDDQPAYFVLSAYCNSDGDPTRDGAIEMKRFPFEGYVGSHTGTTDRAYYRFTPGSAGDHTINVGGYACGGTSHVQVTLYEPPLDESSPFNAGYALASSAEHSCSQNMTQSLEANREYFLKITNRTDYMKTFRPAPGSRSFTIDIQR